MKDPNPVKSLQRWTSLHQPAAIIPQLIFTSDWSWFVTFIMSFECYKPKPVTCKNELGNYSQQTDDMQKNACMYLEQHEHSSMHVCNTTVHVIKCAQKLSTHA